MIWFVHRSGSENIQQKENTNTLTGDDRHSRVRLAEFIAMVESTEQGQIELGLVEHRYRQAQISGELRAGYRG